MKTLFKYLVFYPVYWVLYFFRKIVRESLKRDLMRYKRKPYRLPGIKIHRNDPCPCGSGKKVKRCHGK